jgi:hypothetical protein
MSTTKLCQKGCGEAVHGQGARICDDCSPKCACGRRRLSDRPRCRRCAQRITATAGRIVWRKKPNGIFVAR